MVIACASWVIVTHCSYLLPPLFLLRYIFYAALFVSGQESLYQFGAFRKVFLIFIISFPFSVGLLSSAVLSDTIRFCFISLLWIYYILLFVVCLAHCRFFFIFRFYFFILAYRVSSLTCVSHKYVFNVF